MGLPLTRRRLRGTQQGRVQDQRVRARVRRTGMYHPVRHIMSTCMSDKDVYKNNYETPVRTNS
eukprot:30710-Eustigmatos_ZCMA.PRE.1